MWLGQVIVEHSRKTCDHKTFVHRLCKSSISSIQNIIGNSIEFFLNIYLGWTLSLHDSMLTHYCLYYEDNTQQQWLQYLIDHSFTSKTKWRHCLILLPPDLTTTFSSSLPLSLSELMPQKLKSETTTCPTRATKPYLYAL